MHRTDKDIPGETRMLVSIRDDKYQVGQIVTWRGKRVRITRIEQLTTKLDAGNYQYWCVDTSIKER